MCYVYVCSCTCACIILRGPETDNEPHVQVTGELSTAGRPMRAFVQTFVLAPESPKKYYVRNDFFRYQDDDLASESETNETPG